MTWSKFSLWCVLSVGFYSHAEHDVKADSLLTLHVQRDLNNVAKRGALKQLPKLKLIFFTFTCSSSFPSHALIMIPLIIERQKTKISRKEKKSALMNKIRIKGIYQAPIKWKTIQISVVPI